MRAATRWCVVVVALLAAGCEPHESEFTAVGLADVQAILSAHGCAVGSCHSGDHPGAGLNLTESQVYTSLVNQPCSNPEAEVLDYLLVAPYEPSRSFLLHKLELEADDPVLGGPMPAVGDRLSAAELALITRWIEDGAPVHPLVPSQAALDGE